MLLPSVPKRRFSRPFGMFRRRLADNRPVPGTASQGQAETGPHAAQLPLLSPQAEIMHAKYVPESVADAAEVQAASGDAAASATVADDSKMHSSYAAATRQSPRRCLIRTPGSAPNVPREERDNVNEIVNAISFPDVLIIYTGTGPYDRPFVCNGGCEKNLTIDLGERTKAVVFLVNVEFPLAAAPIVYDVSEEYQCGPIIAILLRGPRQSVGPAAEIMGNLPFDNVVVQPASTEEISTILSACIEEKCIEKKKQQNLCNEGKVEICQSNALSCASAKHLFMFDGGLENLQNCTSEDSISTAFWADAISETPSSLQEKVAEQDFSREDSISIPCWADSISEPPSSLQEEVAEQEFSREDFSREGSAPDLAAGSARTFRQKRFERESMAREVKILGTLQHPTLLTPQELIDKKSCKQLGPSTETNLEDRLHIIGRCTAEGSQVLFFQVASCLSYLHDKDIAHRNINPETVQVNHEMKITIMDFSNATSARTKQRGILGTVPFVPVEVMQGIEYVPAHVDVWSMGVLLMDLLCGLHKIRRFFNWDCEKRPLLEHVVSDMQEAWSRPKFIRECFAEDGVEAEKELEELLDGMLAMTPRLRWSSPSALRHEWTFAATGYGISSVDHCLYHGRGIRY